MNRLSLFCMILLLLMASSALTQDVKFDYDDNADFSKFKTYKWVYF